MFRTAVYLTSAICALPAIAEDFTVNAPVQAVTVYPNGATLTRGFVVDLPAGAHRILMPMPTGMERDGLPRIDGLGAVSIGSFEYLPDYVTDADTLRSPAQLAAAAAVERAQAALQAAQDALARAQAQTGGIVSRIQFLQSVSAGSVDALDADQLLSVSEMIGAELSKAYLAQQQAIEETRVLADAQEDAAKVLAQARQDLARLTPPVGPVDMLAISVDVPAAVQADLSLSHLIRDASWRATYALDLDRDDGEVSMDRKVVVEQYSGELWSDVALTLSTADPFSQLAPQEVYPNPAQIVEPQERSFAPSSVVRSQGADLAESLSDPIIEEPVRVTAGVVLDGLSVTYPYPQPVSITTNGGALVLALDELAFEAEQFNRAVPRRDKTVFLMARFTNDQPEPILAGRAQLYRDGNFVGSTSIETVPAGAETTVSFGGLEGLRLNYKLLNNDTGDRGLLSTSNTRSQQMEFSVENLTAVAETVEALFALPFAEQEDLSVKVTARPAPDARDVEKRRGVSQWDLSLAPGEKQTVTLNVDLSWPEGARLLWRP